MSSIVPTADPVAIVNAQPKLWTPQQRQLACQALGIATRQFFKLINLQVLPVDPKAMPRLRGPSDQRRLRLYENWRRTLPVNLTLADIDALRRARFILAIPPHLALTPHVRARIFSFLKQFNALSSLELKTLLGYNLSKDMATRAALAKATDRRMPTRSRAELDLETFRQTLPPTLRFLAQTGLCPRQGHILRTPDSKALARLANLQALRPWAATYILRNIAMINAYGTIGFELNGLARLDASVTQLMTSGATLQDAWTATLKTLVAESNAKTANGRRAFYVVQAAFNMMNAYRRYQTEVGTLQAAQLPPLPVLDNEFGLRTRYLDVMRAIDQAAQQRRTKRVTPLCENFTHVQDLTSMREHAVRQVFEIYEAMRESLLSSSDPYVDFATLAPGEEDRSQVHTTCWRIWRREAFCKAYLIGTGPAQAKSGPVLTLLESARRDDVDTETFLEHLSTHVDGEEASPPFFVTLSAVDITKGASDLPSDIRLRRYELLRTFDLPTFTPAGLCEFGAGSRILFRRALTLGHRLIPIVQIALGVMQAKLAFDLCVQALPRSSELLQIEADGSNIEPKGDGSLFAWQAYGKGSGIDLAYHKDSKDEFVFTQDGLGRMLDLKNAMQRSWGENAWAAPQKVNPELECKFPPGNFLFRTRDRHLACADIQYLISYLLLGISRVSVHDLRAAVAKLHLTLGTHPQMIQDILHHQDQKTTRRYTQLPPAMAAVGLLTAHNVGALPAPNAQRNRKLLRRWRFDNAL